jgi:phosphatidylinositol alpha-mannosyltransferase
MRIGVVSELYEPCVGAVPDHVRHFAREARRLGHVVKIVTGEMPDLPRSQDADRDVIRVGSSLPVYRGGALERLTGGAGVGAAIREVLARERFDVVHVHAPLTPVLPLLAVHHAAGPVVGTFHAPFRAGLLLRLLGRTLQRHLDRLDAVVASSRACLAPIEERLHGDVRVIPTGVDVARLARGRRIRRYEDGKLNVLYAGPLEPRGGLERLIPAFHCAWRQVDARLIVLGAGPLLPWYRALVPRELSEEVVFAGRVTDERADWYATADVCCAPGLEPGAGAEVLEGMAAGRPVLAADLEGHRELMHHGREGELLAPEEPAAWARALVRLSRDPLRAAAYGEHGRFAAQRHAWPAVAREILGLYRAVGVRG